MTTATAAPAEKNPKGKQPGEQRPKGKAAKKTTAKKAAKKKAAKGKPANVLEPEDFKPDTRAADKSAVAVTKEELATYVHPSPTDVQIDAGCPYDAWLAYTEGLKNVVQLGMFLLGDALRFGEANFGEDYSQALDATGLTAKSISNAMSVCGSVPPGNRVQRLSFGHHEAVAALGLADQKRVLKTALDEELSVKKTREMAKAIKGDSAPPEPPKKRLEILDDEDAIKVINNLVSYLKRGDSEEEADSKMEPPEEWTAERLEPWRSAIDELEPLVARIYPNA